MAAVFPLANYRSFPFALTGASDTVICTCPTGFWWRVCHVLVSVGTGAAGTANLGWKQNSAAGTRFVMNDAAVIASGIPAEWEGMPLVLEATDTINVTAANGNHVIVSLLEEARTPGQKGPSAGLPGLGNFGPGWAKTR